MVNEVLEALRAEPGGFWLDGTSGGGGHGEAILRATSPNGFLWACDQDGDAIEASDARLKPYAGRFELRRMNFAEVADWIPEGTCDGALLDLGVSSHQLDAADRGFSFMRDGPLDMRMDDRLERTAADIVNEWSAEELADAFWKYSDERASRAVARAIVKERSMRPFESTQQLAECVARVLGRGTGRIHPATRAFQALRIVVNREWEMLLRGLEATFNCLKSGGRLVVLTFHSGEDRLVKQFQRDLTRDYVVPGDLDIPELRVPREPLAIRIHRRPLEASSEEVTMNPRARSVRLRTLEKL
jgi:16S rRNA (cytosine1402-N4)-methyltransferase